jgi:YbbR domain-containing protein
MQNTLSLRFLSILAAAMALVSAAAAKSTEKIEQTYPLNADGAISLTNVNGDVQIDTWDRNEVSLYAEKIASSDDGLALIDVKVEHTPEHLNIKVEHQKKFKFWTVFNRSEVRFKLRVPAGVTLKKIDVVNSDVTVKGVRGHVNLNSINGSIEADGLAAGGSFDTVNGSISASFAKLSAGDKVLLDTVNGSCKVTLPADAAFNLDADSVNGSITCDYPITIGRSGRRHLAGAVNGGGAKVSLDSVNGGLRIRSAK